MGYELGMPVLVHLSDLHFGPKFVEHLAELILREISDEKPDVVVVSGDWTLRGRVSEYQRAREYLRKLPPPVFTIPGNHDQPLHWGGLYDRFTRPWARYKTYIHPKTDTVFQAPELFIIGLNDNHPILPGGIWTGSQRRWIERELAAAPESACKVLVTHHQLLWEGKWRPAGHWFPTRTLTRLAGLGVELVLNGHTHIPLAKMTPQGIVVAQSGTAMSTRTRHGQANAYCRIEISENEIDVDIRAFDPNSDRFLSQSHLAFPRRQRTIK